MISSSEKRASDAIPEVKVVVVGSGFAGIGMGIRLKQAGVHDFVVFEASDRVGGVWRDNTYPGVACDVPAHLYSYSFEPNPLWSRFFAPQNEILAYLEACASKYQVRPHIRFSEAVVRASFDEDQAQWNIETNRGNRIHAKVLVSASGHALSKPIVPQIQGLESFEGKVFHSARWDHHYSLDGKRVAVIGTGASAVQIVPKIVDRVSKLLVFQRTAPWVVPRPDFSVAQAAKQILKNAPFAQTIFRSGIYSVLESGASGFVWNPKINSLRQRSAERFLEESVRDPILRKRLTPNFAFGCKRILLSNDWYPALQKPQSEVITSGIRSIDASGITTQDGIRREVDAIVFATGFEAAEGSPPFALQGLSGLRLEDAWAKEASAYLGATVAGFPNFLMLLGPNTGLGHSSMIYMMESQMNYIVDAVLHLGSKGLRWFDVKPEVVRDYNREIQARLAKTIWAVGGCQSWYINKEGKNTTLWPGFTFEFRKRTKRFDFENYKLVGRARHDSSQS